MTSVFSYLIIMMACIFWIIRVVITVCFSLDVDIGIAPLNSSIEIILLFVTLICIVFIIKRKIFGAIVYLLANGLYFGDDVFFGIKGIIDGQADSSNYISLVLSIIGIIIPVLIVLDIFFNKEGNGKTTDKKTDWFYKNKQFDRDFDERADRNQYKF